MTVYLADRGKQAPVPDRQPSPLTFSSNNPFRNRATSPQPHAISNNIITNGAPAQQLPQPQQQQPPARMSKNPFLDASEIAASPTKDSGVTTMGMTEDIFKDLSLLDKPNGNGNLPPAKSGPPPSRNGTLPPPGHRPSASDERRGPPRPPRGSDSPSKREHRPRPRGMSESSVIDEKERRERRDRERGERPARTESEERRRRERRREREERHRREKEKIRNGGGSTKVRKPQGLDIIDKLDVTGIYGQGLFHHDGPFDACNPHRNKPGSKTNRPAPMQAFPADSMNMRLGGSGPLRSRIDLDKFHGRGDEGFSDYAVTKKANTQLVDPKERGEQVHGDESYGLGTSTFLEGAPASKSALQRRESEDQDIPQAAGGTMGGGLTRKKSLAQRFRARGLSGGRRGGPNSPEARYNVELESSPPQGQMNGRGAISAGGPARARYTNENEVNPFDQSYDDAFDKKGAQIRIAEQERPSGGRPRAPSSPKRNGLVRSMTADGPNTGSRGSSNEEDRFAPPAQSGGGGFLSRMKSLKGGKRARPERRDT